MQHDWFMYHLRSIYKNHPDFPFKVQIDMMKMKCIMQAAEVFKNYLDWIDSNKVYKFFTLYLRGVKSLISIPRHSSPFDPLSSLPFSLASSDRHASSSCFNDAPENELVTSAVIMCARIGRSTSSSTELVRFWHLRPHLRPRFQPRLHLRPLRSNSFSLLDSSQTLVQKLNLAHVQYSSV